MAGTPISKRADTAARRESAIQLHLAGRSWESIATELGYSSRGAAHTDVKRALDERRKSLGLAADQFREAQKARLQQMREIVYQILAADHPVVQGGKIVRVGTAEEIRTIREQFEDTEGGIPPEVERVLVELGRPMYDDAPKLAALDRLLKIEQREAALLGLDAATKSDVTQKVTYELVGIPIEDV